MAVQIIEVAIGSAANFRSAINSNFNSLKDFCDNDAFIKGVDQFSGDEIADGSITLSKLDQGVKNSLSKADSAYQKPSGGIPVSDLASGGITNSFIANNANISGSKLADKSIPFSKLQNCTLETWKFEIASGTGGTQTLTKKIAIFTENN